MTISAERAAADHVRERIRAAASRVGRAANSVTLVAAVKTVDPERIAASGVVAVGENRVQDLIAKRDALAEAELDWHFIGALQRNKARKVVGVSLIHSIDSVGLAAAVSRAAIDAGLIQPVLLQVNISGEPSKSGCFPEELPALLDAARQQDGLEVRGLMTVPAPGDPESVRPAFRSLAALAAEHGLHELSMGMTSDFEVAVEEGATYVRVGSAIFGDRHPH